MDADQLNVLAAAIVFESREREWYKQASKELLGDVFYKADKCIDQLHRREGNTPDQQLRALRYAK